MEHEIRRLEKVVILYPDVCLIFVAYLYGSLGKMDEIKVITDRHGTFIIEDAAESFKWGVSVIYFVQSDSRFPILAQECSCVDDLKKCVDLSWDIHDGDIVQRNDLNESKD